jgi:predicted ATPase/class 3 adenylate cyclase
VPAETPTLLFTDIEGSTALFERVGEVFTKALTLHHAVIRHAVETHGGQVFRDTGDGLIAGFEQPKEAVAAAIVAQQALRAAEWPVESGPLLVRMGIHRGPAEFRDGEYRGLTMHYAARVMSAAHGTQILCSSGVVELLDGETIKTCDLGLYRLKGILQPVRLFAVVQGAEYPGLSPLNVPAAFTHSLPAPSTRYFGRESEIEELAVLLTPDVSRKAPRKPGRLVTLLGPGGTGKTRLAIEVATRLLPKYSHAVWFVPLAELRQPDLLLDELRGALGISGEPHETALTQLKDYLDAQPSLLVLDNLEQLLPEAADVVKGILADAPSLACLVTSRVRLNLSVEQVFSVPALSAPALHATADDLLECAAVELFVDRARAVRREFAVTDANAADIALLIRALEGIPLAIELAAARVAILTPSQILQRMSRRLELLAGGPLDAPERHRALRATIDWSYNLLPEDLQRFFARLSVFRGGWTLEAAEEVAAGSDVSRAQTLEYLAKLCAKSLTRAEQTEDEMRYSLLEIIREYASERLACSEEAQAVAAKHARYFIGLAANRLDGNEAAGFSQFVAEYDNLRAVLDSDALEEDRAKLACSLRPFWMTRGLLTEGRRCIRSLRKSELPPHSRASLACAEGILDWKAGDFARAGVNLDEALALFRGLGDDLNAAGILNNLGILADSQGDVDAAEAYFVEALAIYQAAQDLSHTAAVLSNLGVLELNRNCLAKAGEALDESLEIQEELGEQWSSANTLHNLAELQLRLGNCDLARIHLSSSLRSRAALGARDVASLSFGTLGEIALAEGRETLAALLFSAAEYECEIAEVQPRQTDREKWATEFSRVCRGFDPQQVALLRKAAQRLRPEDALQTNGDWSLSVLRMAEINKTWKP